MDQYLPISILSTRMEANHACALLEDSQIPIMLQYIEVEEQGEKIGAYRLLVPMQFTQRSLKILQSSQLEELPAKAA
jgi:hypothetical protein